MVVTRTEIVLLTLLEHKNANALKAGLVPVARSPLAKTLDSVTLTDYVLPTWLVFNLVCVRLFGKAMTVLFPTVVIWAAATTLAFAVLLVVFSLAHALFLLMALTALSHTHAVLNVRVCARVSTHVLHALFLMAVPTVKVVKLTGPALIAMFPPALISTNAHLTALVRWLEMVLKSAPAPLIGLVLIAQLRHVRFTIGARCKALARSMVKVLKFAHVAVSGLALIAPPQHARL
jgi:hypothetical protein